MSLFSTDSILYKALTWLGNIIILNFIWLLFSLPIVTIGASTVAAYSMLFKLLEGKEGYLFSGFVKEFKANWKQGTVIWAIMAVAAYAIYIDIQLLLKSDPGFLFITLSIVGIVIIAASLIYAFALSARYENKVLMHIKNSFLLSVNHPLKTLMLMLVVAGEVSVFFWNFTTMILIVLVGPMVLITTITATSKKVFNINDKKNAENGAPVPHAQGYGEGDSNEPSVESVELKTEKPASDAEVLAGNSSEE